MPKFLEDKLKARYGADSSVPYKIMNSIGAMHGNKETAKGAAMEAKHEADMKSGTASGSGSSKKKRHTPQQQAVLELMHRRNNRD